MLLRSWERRDLPKPAAKAARLFERDGLYLEVSPAAASGGLEYRYAGKEKRVSL
jgi:hypothetical protein